MPYRPLASEAGFVHICAHRGHSIGAPENTLPALTEAARLGATVCEIDIVLTADDEIVLLHDEILDRTTNGKGRVSSYNLADIKALDAGSWFDPRFAGVRPPTLGEALETAKAHGLALLVEIKERQRPDVMIERLGAVLKAQNAVDDVLVISFDHPSLVRARERIPGLRTEIITHARHVDPVAIAHNVGATSVAIEWDMFHPDDARALHDAGIATRVTIPRPDRIAFRANYGLDLTQSITAALRLGLIDVLAGDDTVAVRNLTVAAKT
ncbi:glycerophosphodiester phosphodiesterase [Terrarubrum flagellatum]|uniref:glycerophosphodiester phosphodiesterase n=1 Tax=Terrirubrum flagellatum TaxID=2895980 RepID=UPI00314534A1